MAVDFKTDRIRTYSIVASGSLSNAPGIWIQGSGSATDFAGSSTLDLLSKVGSDTFLFVSGAIGKKNVAFSKSTSVFGGDVVISGSLYDGSGTAYSPGAGGSPGSPVNSVQFNNAGSFGGSANLAFDSASNLLSLTGSLGMKGNITPDADFTYDLGTSAKRWQNVYTGDLHLRNDRGDWTIVEEEDFLCVINNKTGKRYKMMLQPID